MFHSLISKHPRKIQSVDFTNQILKIPVLLSNEMLPNIAFVPEDQGIHYFIILMEEFPTSLNINSNILKLYTFEDCFLITLKSFGQITQS